MILVYLTCKDREEANLIGDTLLKKRLVTCVKTLPISSKAWWQGEIQSTEEIFLIMESAIAKFDAIEDVVNEIHSYDVPMLACVDVEKVPANVLRWLNEELS